MPSLHVVCIWRSAHGVDSHAGSASSVRRTSAYVRNPRRVSSSGIAGGASSQASIRSATHGPMARSSVSGRPEPASSPASSGQNRDAVDARSSALRRWSDSSRAALRSSSPRSPFVSDVARAFGSDLRAPVSSRLRSSPSIGRRCLAASAYIRSGSLSERTLAIEDSPNGIRAAKAAGIPFLCVPNAATAGLDLSEPDLVVISCEGLSVELRRR